MCCHHIKSEPRSQTFTLHARPNPICAVDYVKLQSHWSSNDPEKAFLSIDIATFLVCARKLICSLAFLKFFLANSAKQFFAEFARKLFFFFRYFMFQVENLHSLFSLFLYSCVSASSEGQEVGCAAALSSGRYGRSNSRFLVGESCPVEESFQATQYLPFLFLSEVGRRQAWQ